MYGELTHTEADYIIRNFVKPGGLPWRMEDYLEGHLERAYLDYTGLSEYHDEYGDTVLYYRADAWFKSPAGHWVRVHCFGTAGLDYGEDDLSSRKVRVDISRSWPFAKEMDHYPTGFSFEGPLEEALALSADEVAERFEQWSRERKEAIREQKERTAAYLDSLEEKD